MNHVILLGDSIFDNARYVPGGPSVIQHLQRALPTGWKATLGAVDGAIAEDVHDQLKKVPKDATHLVVSAGGNNALSHSAIVLNEGANSFAEVMSRMGAILADFQDEYRRMLQAVVSLGKPTVVCTIYDAVPDLRQSEFTGLRLFNEAILKEAVGAGVPIIDLRHVCNEAADYAQSSPIEPSVYGGGKIARAVARVVTEHSFTNGGCRVYV